MLKMAGNEAETSVSQNKNNADLASGNVEGAANKKSKSNEIFSCTICNLTFTNNCVLESHLAGKRHQKILRSRNLGGLIKDSSGQNEVTDTTIIGEFFCKDCGIYANSSNQLEMHMKSNKHILKVEKMQDGNNVQENKVQSTQKNKAKPVDGKSIIPTKKVKSEVPPEVFKCLLCNVEMNSKTQYEQHLTSNKHKNKQNPAQAVPRSKSSSAKRKGAVYMAKRRQSRFGLGYDQPLSKSFVSGGSYANNSDYNSTSSYATTLYGKNKQFNQYKTNFSSFGSTLSNNVGNNKFNGANFRSSYGHTSTNLQSQNYNAPLTQAAKKAYYGDNYSANFAFNSQAMATQYNIPPVSYNNPQSKANYAMW